jgi:hypothetical protein
VKRLSADDTEGEGPCGKYVIARRLFYLGFQLRTAEVHIQRLLDAFHATTTEFATNSPYLNSRPAFLFLL